jgi:hypothetical protein
MSSRRQFRLPSADEAFLDRLGLPWETIVETNRRWLFISGFAIPAGYLQRVADMAIEIVGGYPPGPLDMAYFAPALMREDRRLIPMTNYLPTIDNKQWQRWSRHRHPQDPWIMGEDNLATHVYYVTDWLAEEIKRVL